MRGKKNTVNNAIREKIEYALAKVESGDKVHTLVTAVMLPTGAFEVAVNTDKLHDKLKYILSAYDNDMRLKANDKIAMFDAMILFGERE